MFIRLTYFEYFDELVLDAGATLPVAETSVFAFRDIGGLVNERVGTTLGAHEGLAQVEVDLGVGIWWEFPEISVFEEL